MKEKQLENASINFRLAKHKATESQEKLFQLLAKQYEQQVD